VVAPVLHMIRPPWLSVRHLTNSSASRSSFEVADAQVPDLGRRQESGNENSSSSFLISIAYLFIFLGLWLHESTAELLFLLSAVILFLDLWLVWSLVMKALTVSSKTTRYRVLQK
jgi:hypothetical protein